MRYPKVIMFNRPHMDVPPLKRILGQAGIGRSAPSVQGANTADSVSEAIIIENAQKPPAPLGAMSGDDLLASRAFVDAAGANITDLLDPENHTIENITTRLSRIVNLSKGVSARAIDRAATTALDMSETSGFEKSAQWHGQILVLNKLIAQYGIGLKQVEAELENMAAGTPVVQRAAATPVSTVDLEKNFKIAQETLGPLLKFAEDDKQRSALMALAKIDNADEASPPLKMPRASTAPDTTTVPFETAASEFTTSALRAARQSDKKVSVSFGADGQTDIPASKSAALGTLLRATAEGIIAQWLERPELRQARGDAGAGHIAITAKGTAKNIIISFALPTAINRSFDAAGLRAPLTALNAAVTSEVTETGATLVLTLDKTLAAKRAVPVIPAPVAALDVPTLGDALSQALV